MLRARILPKRQLNRRGRDVSRARVDAGESPAMEANLAEIRFGQRKKTLVAVRDHAESILALKRPLNVAPETTLDPQGELRTTPVSYVRAGLVVRGIAARPDLGASRREVGGWRPRPR